MDQLFATAPGRPIHLFDSLYLNFRRALVAPLARLTLPDKVDRTWLAKQQRTVARSERLRMPVPGADSESLQTAEAFAWLVRIKLARARVPVRFEARRTSADVADDPVADPRGQLLTLVGPTSMDELHAWAAREWAGVQPASWSQPVTETDIVNCLLRSVAPGGHVR